MIFDEMAGEHVQNSLNLSDFLGWKCPTKVENVLLFLRC